MVYSSKHQAECWRNGCLTMVEKMRNSPEFVERLNRDYDAAFIALPQPGWDYIVLPPKLAKPLSGKALVVAGIGAIMAENPVVSRRFWQWRS